MKKIIRVRGRVLLLLALTIIHGLAGPRLSGAEEAKLGAAITSLPCTITTSGVYVLQQDFLSVNLASGAAIVVAADNVTINLNGHTISNAAAGASTGASGVYAANHANITVRNGTLRGFLRTYAP
jgi:hypothetical protein